MKTTEIYGKKIMYEEDAQGGYDYLRSKIEKDEALVYFDQAKVKGAARFEDQAGKDYSLIYNNGAYVITRRAQGGSGSGSGGTVSSVLDNILPF